MSEYFASRPGWGVSLLRITLALWMSLLCVAAACASGDDRLVALRATITITNNGDRAINPYTQRITYPAADIAQQQLQRIEYRHAEPYAIGTHPNGVDKYIEFSVNIPPRSTLERQAVFYLRLMPYNYKADTQPVIAALADSDRYFLKPTQYVESDSPEVKRIAEYIRRTYTGKENQLKAAYLYPQSLLKYRNMDNRGALYALHNRIGDCTEYAAVFISIARAMGVPARLTSEFRFDTDLEFSQPNHNAAEVYLDGRWIPVDPNLALDPSLGYGFGLSSVNKVVLKRDGSWVWSNRIEGVSKQYRDAFIDVGVVWDVKVL